MKITGVNAYQADRRNGSIASIEISLETENELEKAIMLMAKSGKREVDVFSNGNSVIRITMPRGKK